ncbi:MAG TPA: RluA family pseudouridine synthase [Polyangiaceae bacterium]|nr:RluA family pseudouridine synthase [Polyangiaceae bacterium]
MTSNEVASYVVPDELHGERLDKAAAKLATGMSVARLKRAIEEGYVRVDGRRRPKGAPVAKGETITIATAGVAAPDEPAVAEPDAPLAVRFEAATVLVVDKPAGQPTAPLRAGERGTLANALVGHYPELAGVGYGPREPGILHRLDTFTSGLLVVARTSPAFAVLRAALQEGRIAKKYLLVCASEGLADEGTIAHPLANHPKDQRRVLACIHPRDLMRYTPRPATTRYHVLERGPRYALVEAVAEKALRHQIRAHFSSIGHPLLGDELYGSTEQIGRHALHASHVAFDGEGEVPAFSIDSPLPDDLRALMR